MTLALYGKSRKRRGGLLLAALLAVIAATIGGLAVIGSAFAHNASYDASSQCDASWTAIGRYLNGSGTGTSDRRLVVLHSFKVNGSSTPSGATGLATNQNFSSGPDGTSGVVLNTTYGDSLTGATISAGDYIWVGAQTTTGTLFNMSGGAGTLNLGPGAWGGSITLYQWNSGSNSWQHTDSSYDAAITAPPAATGCGEIHVKKVVTGAGAPVESFSANVSNNNGPEGDLNNLSFSAAAEGLDSFTGNGYLDDFTVTEAAPPANWVLAGVKNLRRHPLLPERRWKLGCCGRGEHQQPSTQPRQPSHGMLPQPVQPAAGPQPVRVEDCCADTTSRRRQSDWDITIDNTGQGTIAQTGFIVADSGATLDSVSTAGACGTLPDGDGSFTCNVAANSTLVLHVSKPLSAATNANNTCVPGTIDNTATAHLATGTPITVTATTTTLRSRSRQPKPRRASPSRKRTVLITSTTPSQSTTSAPRRTTCTSTTLHQGPTTQSIASVSPSTGCTISGDARPSTAW